MNRALREALVRNVERGLGFPTVPEDRSVFLGCHADAGVRAIRCGGQDDGVFKLLDKVSADLAGAPVHQERSLHLTFSNIMMVSDTLRWGYVTVPQLILPLLQDRMSGKSYVTEPPPMVKVPVYGPDRVKGSSSGFWERASKRKARVCGRGRER